MNLRRYVPLAPSRGTQIPARLRLLVLARDGGCVGTRIGMPGDCFGQLELDHVRASHGIGMKSSTEPSNLISLCAAHHRIKTNAGRTWRPILLRWIELADDPHAEHVDPCGLDCRASVPLR